MTTTPTDRRTTVVPVSAAICSAVPCRGAVTSRRGVSPARPPAWNPAGGFPAADRVNGDDARWPALGVALVGDL